MTDPNEEQLRSIWSQGHWLARCDRAFSSKSQTEVWEELNNISAMELFQNELADQDNGEQSWLEAFSKALKPASVIITQRANLNSEVRKDVLSYLNSQQLVGIGFETPRRLDDTPKLLPSEVWGGFVNWEGSSLKYQSLSFVDIRIVAPAWIAKILSGYISIEKTLGRPSVASDLESCFQALMAAQRFDLNGSMKSNYVTIRGWLTENLSPEGAKEYKISDEAIRKYFSPYFNALKAEVKQDCENP